MVTSSEWWCSADQCRLNTGNGIVLYEFHWITKGTQNDAEGIDLMEAFSDVVGFASLLGQRSIMGILDAATKLSPN